MAFAADFYRGQQEQYTRNETRRTEKAKAFNEYVKARVDNGEEVDPYELDRVRLQMVGGDPFAATYIPSGKALEELAKRSNDAARLTNLQTKAESATAMKTERDFLSSVMDEFYDKSPDEMPEVLEKIFGPEDGRRIYDQYKPMIPAMLSEATGKKQAALLEHPAAKLIKSDEDIQRFFPAESRNPRVMSILKNIASDNKREEIKQGAMQTATMVEKAPAAVMGSEANRKWWADLTAQSQGYPDAASMPDKGAQIMAGMSAIGSQMEQEGESKLLEAASKSQYFMNAMQTGDDSIIFPVIKSLMVQAGLPAPQSQTDPSYIKAKKVLDQISLSTAVADYQKRAAELKTAYIEEAQAIEKSGKDRTKIMIGNTFYQTPYVNADGDVDPRIEGAINAIVTNSAFFPEDQNIASAIDFVRKKFDEDPDKFDPAAASAQFMAEGNYTNRSRWVDTYSAAVLEQETGFPPNTNVKVEVTKRLYSLNSIVEQRLEKITKTPTNMAEYNAQIKNKNDLYAALKEEHDKLRALIESTNTDPAKRMIVQNFDYGTAVSQLQDFERKLNAIKQLSPPPPPEGLQSPPQEGPKRSLMQQVPRDIPLIPGTGLYSPASYSDDQSASRLDTFLDALADVESSGDPFARATTSSAKGMYQFTDATWNAMVDRYGKTYGITREDVFNPNAQRIMVGLLTRDNAMELMRKTGKDPDEGDLYLAHFLGPSRAATVINNIGTQQIAAQLFPDAARANRNIFYKDGVPVTIEELQKNISSKIKRRIKRDDSRPSTTV